jgi:hypothetical protein
MSFFSEASLAMIPSGYKTSKVYSALPTSGDGDLTFTRSNDTATRVGPNGYIEKVRTNLVLQSEAFNTTWSASNVSVTANTTANPLNGALTADTITLDAGTSGKNVSQNFSQNGVFTQSVYLKAGTHQFVQLLLGDDVVPRANFDLVNGTATATSSTASIVSAGNGWFRCSMSYNTPNGSVVYLWAVDSLAASRAESSASTGTFFAFGFQLETGDIATDYIATTSAAVTVGPVANVPRLDYLDSSSPRLLLEPQRSNLLFYSEQFNNAWWAGSGSVIANTATSPDGTLSADTNNPTGVYPAAAGVGDATIVNTASIFAKANPSGASTMVLTLNKYGTGDAIVCTFNLTTGTAGAVTLGGSAVSGTAKIENYGNGWYRCILTGIASTSAGALSLSPANNCFIWGAMIEAGAYATSYIPTLGAAVTRGKDASSKTGISSLIGSTEGVLYAEVDVKLLQQSGRILLDVNDNDTNNRVILLLNGSAVEGFVQGSTRVAYTLPSAGIYKFAFAYKSGDFALYVNGVQQDTSTDAITFSGMNQLFLGHTFNINDTQPVDGIKSSPTIPDPPFKR